MVNNTNLDTLITDFQQSTEGIKRHTYLFLSLYEARDRGDELVKMDLPNARHIYESSLLSAVVAWHSFASDWILTAIACDVSTINSKLQEAQAASFKVKGQLVVYARPQLIRRKPSVSEVRDLLEGSNRGSNLSIYDQSGWSRFRNILGPEYAARVDNFNTDDYTVMRLSNVMRNYAAHKSEQSREKLNMELRSASVKELDEHEGVDFTYEKKRVTNLGEYLFAYSRNPKLGQHTRLGYLLYRLISLSEKLR
ncbi:hypothetical protein CYJ73_25815 [Gordonia terrae]|uniref:RiboL-PSP-HEPN domain-containing protein n=1 Tax=Gordonia terrae TaxID=2055 RepID=A0A2I1R0P6_9ACTN|nr:hypothetical protein [Gordonia terrae]PKZ62671.1 hypothetical protein CYJ73_25815 [Gordonia terrae]